MNEEEVREAMMEIGFDFEPIVESDGLYHERLIDTPDQRQMFAALQRLIAAAIWEWADLRHDVRHGEGTQQGVMDELEEWAQEWLVG